MGRTSRLRYVNSSRWAKNAAILITKELEAIAENTKVNVQLVIAEKLEKTYKDNLTSSYGPRSLQGIATAENRTRNKSTYTNTHNLEDAVNAVITGDTIKIEIDETKTYKRSKDEVTAKQVHDWLSEGTEGGSRKKGEDRTSMSGFYKDTEGKWHYNYPTRAHPFKEHTANEMKSFLTSLETDISNGKYTDYRYTGKKKPRKYYKGVEVAPRER